MRVKKDILERILNVVQKAVFGITFEEIVKETGHHRMTVKKYLDLLEKWGFIVYRRIGYYTLVFPAAIYEFIRNDLAGLYVNALIKTLANNFDFDSDRIRSFSHLVSREFSSAMINILRRFLRDVDEKIEDLSEIVIPTMTPYLKFKMRRLRLSDKLLYMEVLEFMAQDLDKDMVCEFLRGYLAGMLEALDIKFDKIEIIEKGENDSKINCKLVIILQESIGDVANKLKKSETRGKQKENTGVV
ncbi:MAG: hypothetical protein ACP6IP_04030 [Candidatus Njordarchaeia archaeon]